MNGQRQVAPLDAFQTCIVSIDANSEFVIRIAPGSSHHVATSVVEILRVIRRIELDVGYALLGEPLNFTANNFYQVRQKLRSRSIKLICYAFFVARNQEV